MTVHGSVHVFSHQMILPGRGPSSNSCARDWQMWLKTGQETPHRDAFTGRGLKIPGGDAASRMWNTKLQPLLLAFLWFSLHFYMFVLSSFYWRERLKCLLSTSSPTITRGLSVNSLLTLIIVKVPTRRRSLRFGSVLLRQSPSSFQAPSYASRVPLTGLFHISSFLERCPFKNLMQTK